MSTLGRLEWSIPFSSWIRFVLPTLATVPARSSLPRAAPTPGVIGLILHTENHGNIIATSDTIYTAQSYREQLPPGGTINKTTDEFFDNIKRIQALEKEYDATLLFGHDIDQIVDWAKKSPID